MRCTYCVYNNCVYNNTLPETLLCKLYILSVVNELNVLYICCEDTQLEGHIFAGQFGDATDDKRQQITWWYHQLPTTWWWQTQCTCFFLCVSVPLPVAPFGVDVSVGRLLVSVLETVGRRSTHSPVNFDPKECLHRKGAAPQLNRLSCSGNLKKKSERQLVSKLQCVVRLKFHNRKHK